MKSKVDSVYIGKVILNSDIADEDNIRPLGRVKVLIHGVSYINTQQNDEYKYPLGSNIPDGGASPETIKRVKEYEVWAYVLQPVAGTGSMARYNAKNNVALTSDSDNITFDDSTPPAGNYPLIVSDGFSSTTVGTAGVNPNAYAYTPDNRSNSSKGMFALPGIGSTVLVSFINGARGLPIVLGVVPGYDSVESIYGTDVDGVYPGYPLAFGNIE